METNDPKTVKAIHALEAEFETLFNAKKVERLVDTFWTKDIRLLPPNAPTVEGREAVLEAARELNSMFSNLKITPGKVWSSGDLAVAYGTYSAKVQTPDGQTVPDKGKFIEVFRRGGDGSWKCFLDQFNSDIAPEP